ncbi:MAG: hypothetical protein NXH87_18130 [Rhodobiaceae bacterium]|nr:hypothetical protein [Rhodobiaceae bacterium]
MNKLTKSEQKLLTTYRRLSPGLQEAALSFLDSLLKNDRKSA